MDNWTILNILKTTPKIDNTLAAVLPAEILPKKEPEISIKPYALIVNTNQHWVAIYYPKKGYTEYFDSFGKKASDCNIIRILGNEYIYNNKRLQNTFSSVCGQYVCYYLYLRIKKENSMQEILNKFSRTDFAQNDLSVNSWLNNTFQVHQHTHDIDFITKELKLLLE